MEVGLPICVSCHVTLLVNASGVRDIALLAAINTSAGLRYSSRKGAKNRMDRITQKQSPPSHGLEQAKNRRDFPDKVVNKVELKIRQ